MEWIIGIVIVVVLFYVFGFGAKKGQDLAKNTLISLLRMCAPHRLTTAIIF
jgi:hypothetical protein